MKAWKIFTGLGLIFAATLLILDALGVVAPLVSIVGEITMFEIICGLLLIALIIERLVRGRLASIFFLLAFLFMLFEENIAYICHLASENIINNGLVLVIALLLTVGVSILFPSPNRRRKRKGTSGVSYSHSENCLGSAIVYVNCNDFSPSYVENDLGSCAVYFENIESFKGGETLHVENNLGAMSIHVPSDWIVKSDIDTNLGGTSISNGGNECGPILYIKGENSLGALSIEYI